MVRPTRGFPLFAILKLFILRKRSLFQESNKIPAFLGVRQRLGRRRRGDSVLGCCVIEWWPNVVFVVRLQANWANVASGPRPTELPLPLVFEVRLVIPAGHWKWIHWGKNMENILEDQKSFCFVCWRFALILGRCLRRWHLCSVPLDLVQSENNSIKPS